MGDWIEILVTGLLAGEGETTAVQAAGFAERGLGDPQGGWYTLLNGIKGELLRTLGHG